MAQCKNSVMRKRRKLVFYSMCVADRTSEMFPQRWPL